MKMNHLQAPKKQTQNKANFFKGQNELRAYPNNRVTPIPALPKVFDGSINFDIIASRYKNLQS